MLLLSSCAPASVQEAEVHSIVAKDRKVVYTHDELTQPLKLEDVLARALRYNLDTRVSELDELIAADDVTLQMLAALPSVTAKVQRVGRNNPGGSSSFSLLTNTQSLQPSISSDRYRNTQQLNVEWNLLDAGINLWRGRSANDKLLVAQERRRKVYHGVAQDAYAAFWRVAAAQTVLPAVDDLLIQSRKEIASLDTQIKDEIVPLDEARRKKAELMERRKSLLDLKEGLLLSEIELKTLIDFPVNKPIKIDRGGQDWLETATLPKVTAPVEALEDTAFMNRPEVREEILNKRMSLRDIKMSIIETLPGADLVFTYNRDSNSFLSYNKWIDGVVGLTQVINRIITAPARYDRAKKMDMLADRRREALVAAIITQVHVAKGRYDFLADSYNDEVEADRNAREILKRAMNFKDVGMMSRAELLNVQIDSTIAAVNRVMAYANVQDSYGRLITTMGVDLWDADNAGLTVPEFAQQIKKNLAGEKDFLTGLSAGEEVKG